VLNGEEEREEGVVPEIGVRIVLSEDCVIFGTLNGEDEMKEAIVPDVGG
jgi:hypothetical protein